MAVSVVLNEASMATSRLWFSKSHLELCRRSIGGVDVHGRKLISHHFWRLVRLALGATLRIRSLLPRFKDLGSLDVPTELL